MDFVRIINTGGTITSKHTFEFGALHNPSDQAILLFKGATSAVAEKFAEIDPYVKNNLVRKWTVRQWITVVGDSASEPIRST